MMGLPKQAVGWEVIPAVLYKVPIRVVKAIYKWFMMCAIAVVGLFPEEHQQFSPSLLSHSLSMMALPKQIVGGKSYQHKVLW